MDEQPPVRVVVELISSADVKRLEDRDEDVRAEVRRLEAKIDGLHRTIYDLMETIGTIRSKR